MEGESGSFQQSAKDTHNYLTFIYFTRYYVLTMLWTLEKILVKLIAAFPFFKFWPFHKQKFKSKSKNFKGIHFFELFFCTLFSPFQSTVLCSLAALWTNVVPKVKQSAIFGSYFVHNAMHCISCHLQLFLSPDKVKLASKWRLSMCQKNPEISQEMELEYFRIYFYFINKKGKT